MLFRSINVADSNSDIYLKDLAGLLARIAGTKVIYELPDSREQAGYSTATKAVLSTSKVRQLGWLPKTSIEKGLEKTVQVLKGYNEMISA